MACCLSVQCTVQRNSSISETVLNRTHVYIQFLLRITDTVTFQNTYLPFLLGPSVCMYVSVEVFFYSKAATYTQNNTNRINAHRHPCLEWDSNPRSQRSSVHALDRAVTVIGAVKYTYIDHISTVNEWMGKVYAWNGSCTATFSDLLSTPPPYLYPSAMYVTYRDVLVVTWLHRVMAHVTKWEVSCSLTVTSDVCGWFIFFLGTFRSLNLEYSLSRLSLSLSYYGYCISVLTLVALASAMSLLRTVIL
jgi:hypothetical protein